MMSTCQNPIFTLGNGAPLIKFEFAFRSPPSHHLAFGSSLRFSPNFLYNGAMGSHIVSCYELLGLRKFCHFCISIKSRLGGYLTDVLLSLWGDFFPYYCYCIWIHLYAWSILVYICNLAWIDACKLSCMHHWFRVLF